MKYLVSALLVVAVSLASPVVHAAPELADYLPPGVTYDPAIPTPASVLGWEVGTWHVRHDQLAAYMRALAAASDRIALEVTGHTYEGRPLLMLTISTPENLGRIGEIREEHLRLADANAPMPDVSRMPVVVNLGYSVHGNESSGSNAALVVAYHLAAAQDEATQELLRNSVILLDPSLNPDGLSRFAQWANMYRGRTPVGDPNNTEHNEAWPGGRTNHYWFDLNRDWLPAQHPESRARLAQFHAWLPNVLTDAHEMGSDATYFFQPGVSSRRNPLTPLRNEELTRSIAEYHARALDAHGVLYYSQEQFDDFYYGKGSTYPDIHGCIGILFEQASSRGHRRDSVNGTFDFAFTIRNQVLTSFSTLQAALDLREELLRYQRSFYEDVLRNAASGAYVFGDALEPSRARPLVDVLLAHHIEVYQLGATVTRAGATFKAGEAFVVPRKQRQAGLVEALFETRTSFEDSLFYDVSTWTLPLAMGVPYADLSGASRGPRVTSAAIQPAAAPQRGAYAYVFPWSHGRAPQALARLHAAGVRVRVATAPFTANAGAGAREYPMGTLLVPSGIQEMPADKFQALLEAIARDEGIAFDAFGTGLTPGGVDFGSPSMLPLTAPKPLLVIGSGVSSYDAGEAWHLMDERVGLTPVLVSQDDLGGLDLHDYTHLILPGGFYGRLSEDTMNKLKAWVRGGGVLVACEQAAKWVSKNGFLETTWREEAKQKREEEALEKARKDGTPLPITRRDYATSENVEGAKYIGGAIIAADLDITHPLGYGVGRRNITVFRGNTQFMDPLNNPYGTVVQVTNNPVVSGYVHADHLPLLRGAASVVAGRMGRGAVVLMSDNPNFRAFWHGTSRLFLNAVFFGSIIQHTG